MLREAEAGSPAALSALDHVGRWLGIGLAGLINIFDPRLIVLGGTLGRIHPFVSACSRRNWTGVRCPRRAGSSASCRPSSGRTPRCSGAAELAFEPLLADPAAWFPARHGDGG